MTAATAPRHPRHFTVHATGPTGNTMYDDTLHHGDPRRLSSTSRSRSSSKTRKPIGTDGPHDE